MSELSRRDFLKLAILTAASPSFLAACASKDDAKTVNFFNWSAYIAKDTLPRFSLASGVVVNYEVFDDEETMFAKLQAGALGYDLVVATDYMISRLQQLNLIDKFPGGALKNIGNIDPKFRNTPFDPKNEFTVPYLWGTTGIGYNKNKVSRPPTSWMDLWDEKYAGKITMLDNARDCLSTALLIKGYSETTTSETELKAAQDLLLKQRPLVKQYSSSTYIDSLISGESSLAMAWSGDVLQALRENPQLDYVIPKEGSYRWVDNLCLVRNSPHRENALKLADYLIEGKTAAEIADTVRYGSPNAAAKPFMDKALLNDPRVFPPPSIDKRLRFHSLFPPELVQKWNELWSDVKVG